MTETLMRDILTELEIREEDLLEQLMDLRAMSGEDRHIQTIKDISSLRSVIRKCRRVLREVTHGQA